MKYVMDTQDLGLVYDSGTLVNFNRFWNIVAYCDSNYAGEPDTRISVTGYVIYIGTCLSSWKSLGQKSVTLSLIEPEYVAVSEVCAEIIFIKQILEFLGIAINYPITVNCDNLEAIFIAYNAKNSQLTNNVDIRAHYLRKYVEGGIVKIIFVKSELNERDIYTKNVSGAIFRQHATKNIKRVNPK